MTRQEIEEKVRAFLVDELEIDEEKIFPDARGDAGRHHVEPVLRLYRE